MIVRASAPIRSTNAMYTTENTVFFYNYKKLMKPRNPILQSTGFLTKCVNAFSTLTICRSTEKIYLHWVKFFVRWHGADGVIRHPREMGAPE